MRDAAMAEGTLRIAQLTPGTGSFYCGSCLRDHTAVNALRAMGHDVVMVPLYLPFRLEQEASDDAEMYMGGINLYLQHRVKWLSHLPRGVKRLLDSTRLLRWSSKRSDMTDPGSLSELALATIRGEAGSQPAETERLATWLVEEYQPDVIVLSNIMLAGLVHQLKKGTNVPVLCTLHGEDTFLDALTEPARSHAWQSLREQAEHIDAFIAVSDYYAKTMQQRLNIPHDRLHVVHNGIDVDDFIGKGLARSYPPTVMYLARMCRDKGLHTLIEAFIMLCKDERVADVQLCIAGVCLKSDRAFVREMQRWLERSGCRDRVQFLPNVSRERKIELLQQAHVLSVPATYGESFGLYVIEALAAGTPVVQPAHAAFPEIVQRSGGGLLSVPDDAASLADQLARVLSDEALRVSLAARGRASAIEHFSSRRMAADLAEIYRKHARAQQQ